MPLKDRYGGDDKPRGSPSFTCAHYSPKAGTKRCSHYLANGACDRPDELMCIEWLKANGKSEVQPPEKEKRSHDLDRDLFGNPLPPRSKPVEKDPPNVNKPNSPEAPEPPPTVEVPLVRNLNDEEIASFKALGVEVCIKSEDIGELWLVPDYTDQKRKEISVEHAATLSAMCSAFPGAKVASFEKKTEPNPQNDPD
jgi:hypothetical protein